MQPREISKKYTHYCTNTVNMPPTLFTLPRELRDEMFTYIALSSDFTFLLTCRQLNEEGTPLLYKHGIYCVRALTHPNEQLPTRYKPLPSSIARIQNIHISMPKDPRPGWEMSLRATRTLTRFAGTTVERGVCHVDLHYCTFAPDLERMLWKFGGFEIVRVEMWSKCSWRSMDREHVEKERHRFWRFMEDRLGPATFHEPSRLVEVVEFRPRLSRQ